MRETFEVTYDAEADALYIGLMRDFAGRVTTIPSGPSLNFDVVDGQVVGIEVLGAKRHPVFGHLIPESNHPIVNYRLDIHGLVP